MGLAKALIRLRGRAGWSEALLVDKPHCWKSHVGAQLYAADVNSRHLHDKNIGEISLCSKYENIRSTIS